MVNLYNKRYYFFILSALIFVAGLIAYFAFGFKLDIQFEGGTVIEMRANKDTFTEENTQSITAQIAELVQNTVNKPAQVQKSTAYDTSASKSESYDVIKISIGSMDTLTNDELSSVKDAVIKELKLDADKAFINEQSVEPFIGKEISQNGVRAVLISFVLIILYVWFRFKVMSGLSAGVFAIIGVLHDLMVMVAVYLVFRLPINESFIAAILTVVGYSMNDTIIIYDRVRENSRLLKKVPLPELVNTSIIQTLNRSINTVVTSLIAITTVFVFAEINGIASMSEFSFPLIIGIAAGCYSSIFIASPLWVMWKESQKKNKVKPAKV
ncbi:protein translocase subunit SecF [Ruminiclostridium herbifermentans]|uniref:Protein-export membrane protein SecF n=1 Tax=Ruminiclostridium herbifermentans TaxID=2488810 RepID=A0A4U7JIG9_9FIRM|nr:protein translocase subunit SecF [Ruminiclostridium herbifermentans]QNU65427.1 protein translocase subunit SecF [Ruminiclostridium herbifermentans]